MSANLFWCPYCEQMVDRANAELHLRRDAEENTSSGRVSSLELVSRMLARKARTSPQPKT